MVKNDASILLIDDNEAQQLIIKTTLKNAGYENISIFSNADDFLKQIHSLAEKKKKQPSFDLILLDINMPGTNGIDACTLIKKIEMYKETPIIMLTGVSDEHILNEAFIAGAHDFITVPFSKIVFLARVNGAIRLKRERDEKNEILQEKDEVVTKLKEAIDNIKTLTGLIPICANCKNIRGDDGYWDQVEVYISKHSQAVFTHGICPNCAEKLYKEALELKEKKK